MVRGVIRHVPEMISTLFFSAALRARCLCSVCIMEGVPHSPAPCIHTICIRHRGQPPAPVVTHLPVPDQHDLAPLADTQNGGRVELACGVGFRQSGREGGWEGWVMHGTRLRYGVQAVREGAREGETGDAWAHGDLMLLQAGKGWKGR